MDCSGPGDFCEIGNEGDEIQWCITVPPCDGSAKLMTPNSSGVVLGKHYCTQLCFPNALSAKIILVFFGARRGKVYSQPSKTRNLSEMGNVRVSA